MFFLHTSNKTENLIRQLAEVIKTDPLDSLFDKEYLLVQSQGMEMMICQNMASFFTVWGNYRFLFPRTFFMEVAAILGIEMAAEGFERDVLTWRIESLLTEIACESSASLVAYLRDSDQLKRYKLARQVAHVFDQYQLMRTDMLAGWEKGEVVSTLSSAPAGKIEHWQMRLWQKLVAEADGYHRGNIFTRVREALQQKKTIDGLPRRISVFGLHTLPPLFLDILVLLARHCDVHLFLLNPCANYWGESRRRPLPLADEDHPLLGACGQQGREFQKMLLARVDFANEFESFQSPLDKQEQKRQSSLLHCLQDDLLAGVCRKWSLLQKKDRYTDISIRIVSCYSSLRELETLRDHILMLLNENSTMDVSDVVVMAPDIQEYAPFIPAIFKDIPYGIGDRSLLQRNEYITLFQDFLTLCNGRFYWDEVLEILAKEQICGQFGLQREDMRLLKSWVTSAGIRWGLSEKTRMRFGSDFYENSWRAGLDKLLMGYAIDCDAEVAGILPYGDIEGGNGTLLAGLCDFTDFLEEVESNLSKRYSFIDWHDLLLEWVHRLFGSSDNTDFLDLETLLHKLTTYATYYTREVDLVTIMSWFAGTVSEISSSGGLLRGQLTFCSMLPMRSIPFKAVCLLGMNYGVFPRNDADCPFDLMKKKHMPGDRSVRSDDRYQFLEAIVAARESLYISYLGRSLKTNDSLPPSVVVSDLLDVLETMLTAEGEQKQTPAFFVEEQMLYNFSSEYFREDTNLFSYDERACQVARMLQNQDKSKQGWWSGTLDEIDTVIELNDLLAFFKDPHTYFVEKCLGFSFSENKREPENVESFAVTGLMNYEVEQILFQTCMAGGDVSSLPIKLGQSGRWLLHSGGQFKFSKKRDEIESFIQQMSVAELGERQEDLSFDLKVGDYILTGKLSHLYEHGLLVYAFRNFRGGDLCMTWLYHKLARELERPCNTRMFCKNKAISFSVDASGPELADMVTLFSLGSRQPSHLFVESCSAYCENLLNKRTKIPPLTKARKRFQEKLDSGFYPAWQKLFAHLSVEEVIDSSFEDVCQRFYLPMWEAGL